MKIKVNNVNLFVIAIVSNCLLTAATAAVEIKLRERVAPRGSVVRLADVAEISTDDREQGRQLGALPLMPVPAPGTERYLRKREIQDMLAAQGVEVGDFRFDGAEQIAVGAMADESASSNVVRHSSGVFGTPVNRHAAILAGASMERTAQPLEDASENELRERLNSAITNHLNAKTGKVAVWKIDCELESRELGRLAAATSIPVCTGGSEPWTGRQRFTLSFSTADGPVQLPIFAEVSPPPVPVVVAVRPISRGDVIKAADVELRMMEATAKTSGQRSVFESTEKLIGMEARQSIQIGDVVMSDAVQSPILVKRGELITVTSQSGGIRVRTSARALHDGAHGELVQVEAIGSREKYDARIVGSREAAVFATSRPAAPQAQPVETARR